MLLRAIDVRRREPLIGAGPEGDAMCINIEPATLLPPLSPNVDACPYDRE